MSTLAEIEQAVEKLSLEQKRELVRFLGSQFPEDERTDLPRRLPPSERAAELQRWASNHERGPGLPESAIGRDAIYD
jgi:hypothetical protein